MRQYHLQQLTEDHSNLLLIFMPASDILRYFSTLRFVLLIKRTKIGMHIFALSWLLIFNSDLVGHVLQFDPDFTVPMEKFVSQGLYLLDIASID